MDEISFQQPWWWLLIGITAAAVVTALSYYRTRQFSEKPRSYIRWLALLRFLAFSLLFILLMEPLFRILQEKIKKPIIAIGVDNSSSMLTRDSTWVGPFRKRLSSFKDDLANEAEIMSFLFGQSLIRNGDFTGRDKRSETSAFFDAVETELDLKRTKAVVLITDGIYNAGTNPINHDLTHSIPVYTVAMGDTTEQIDLAIRRLYYNELVYSGENILVEVDVMGTVDRKTHSQLNLREKSNGNWIKLDQKKLSFDRSDQLRSVPLEIPAKEPGTYHFQVSVGRISTESNTANNSRHFYVEVLDGKKKILIYAKAAHPDIFALRSAAESRNNYEIDIKYFTEDIKALSSYQLILIHNPDMRVPQFKQRMRQIESADIPSFIFLGSQSYLSGFNKSQEALRVSGGQMKPNNATASFVKDFQAFQLEDGQKQFLEACPPLQVPYGKYETKPIFTTLLKQKIKKIETDYPLLGFYKRATTRHAILAGEGLWRWRMYNYAQKNNFTDFDHFIAQILQYLSSQEDKRKFRVQPAKRIFGGL